MITGLDLFPKFIDLFNQQVKEHQLNGRVEGIVGSMDNLPFSERFFDVIWSEGAIYNIGFERGLKDWKRYLKEGGYIAVTDACWFTDERPDEINDFWINEYPGIDTIPSNMAKLQQAGYIPVASFILPAHCWNENYFEPQSKTQEIFLKKYSDNTAAINFVKFQQHEADLYRRYHEYYGYAFFIGRKI
jgi:SAM-dependent methyltransferase